MCMFWIRGLGPGFISRLGMFFFLNKKNLIFKELDGELRQEIGKHAGVNIWKNRIRSTVAEGRQLSVFGKD